MPKKASLCLRQNLNQLLFLYEKDPDGVSWEHLPVATG